MDRKQIASELLAALDKLVALAEQAAMATDDEQATEIASKAARLGLSLAQALKPQLAHSMEGDHVRHFEAANVQKGGAVTWPADLSLHVTEKRARGESRIANPNDVSEGLLRKRAARARGVR